MLVGAPGPARCDSSHAVITCVLQDAAVGPACSFGLYADGDGGWRVEQDGVQAL